MTKMRQEFERMKDEMRVSGIVYVSDEERAAFIRMRDDGVPLPPDVYETEPYSYIFYRREQPDMTTEEQIEYLEMRQLKELRTVKKCAVFFTVLTIIQLVMSLIQWIAGASVLGGLSRFF